MVFRAPSKSRRRASTTKTTGNQSCRKYTADDRNPECPYTHIQTILLRQKFQLFWYMRSCRISIINRQEYFKIQGLPSRRSVCKLRRLPRTRATLVALRASKTPSINEYALPLRVQTQDIYGFCIRNRNYGLGYIFHIGVLGPLGSECQNKSHLM